MAEANGAGGASVNALAQYAKDLSFENPNAPRSLAPQERGPNISVQVNVNAQQLAETDFEVQLKLEGSAGEGGDTLFKFELEYCGGGGLLNIPQGQIHPVIMIEWPRPLVPRSRLRGRLWRTPAATAASPRSIWIPWISPPFTCSASPKRSRARLPAQSPDA